MRIKGYIGGRFFTDFIYSGCPADIASPVFSILKMRLIRMRAMLSFIIKDNSIPLASCTRFGIVSK